MIKVVLFKDNVTEIETMLRNQWSIIHAFGHPKGVMFVLSRPDQPKKKK